MSEKPFNPLDFDNLGTSIATAILTSDPTPLKELKRFKGAGVYAIYYQGPHPAYQDLISHNLGHDIDIPIYVGKAIPPGGRQGVNVASMENTRALSGRLFEHRRSIEAATNLDVEHFYCRMLIVESIWIPLGESLMITRFSPVWNVMVDGFGNHNPGKGRADGMINRWDVLHPGRAWAEKFLKRNETPNEIEQDVREYFRARLQVPAIDAISYTQPSIELTPATISLVDDEGDE